MHKIGCQFLIQSKVILTSNTDLSYNQWLRYQKYFTHKTKYRISSNNIIIRKCFFIENEL